MYHSSPLCGIGTDSATGSHVVVEWWKPSLLLNGLQYLAVKLTLNYQPSDTDLSGSHPFPGSKNYWSDTEVTSTQYNLNIAPMCFAAWVAWTGGQRVNDPTQPLLYPSTINKYGTSKFLHLTYKSAGCTGASPWGHLPYIILVNIYIYIYIYT